MQLPPLTIVDANGPCRLFVFNGVTLNNDGINDFWLIDNITDFSKNRVSVYNRWGTSVAEITGYDNKTKYWPTNDQASKLHSGTYYYIIDLGDGSPLLKGWVEIIKN
jgi:gliding motility-associated-like protein